MPYILPKMVCIACDILEVLDATETEYVTSTRFMEESGRSYFELAPVLNILRNAGIVKGKTGFRGGYRRAKHLTVLELGKIFSVRFLRPDKPFAEFTKADEIQTAMLDELDEIRA